MFWKKQKTEENLNLILNGKLVFSGSINDIPIKEAVIINKSIAFFNDPEPCQIHRTAVRVRLLAELKEALANVQPEDCALLLEYGDF